MTERKWKWLAGVALLLILLLAAWLRLANVGDNPGWFSDEGTHLAIAGALAEGEQRYLAVSGPTLLFAKLPLFEGALALLLRCCGEGMGTLRAFTGLLGVASVGLLYLVVRRGDGGRGLALGAALALAVYPQAVLYSRSGFSYNLLVPLVLLAFAGLLAFAKRGSGAGLLLAAGAVGLGLISDLMMGVYMPALLWVVVQGRERLSRRLLLGAGLLLVLPASAYAAAMLLTAPEAFLFDAAFTMERLGGVAVGEQVRTLAENLLRLVQDVWWVAGLVGLFLLPRRLRSMALLFLLLPVLLLGRTEALYGLSAYYTIPLLPMVALGVGALLAEGGRFVVARLEAAVGQPGAMALATVLLGTPLLLSTATTVEQVRGRMETAIDPFLVAGPEARAAAAYVNARLAPGELALASPAVAWLIEGQAADFQMAAAATGRATPHLPADVPADRWAFDPRFGRARFVVVDALWRNWAAVHVPGAGEMVEEVAGWPLRLEVGRVRVYERDVPSPSFAIAALPQGWKEPGFARGRGPCYHRRCIDYWE